MLQETVGKFVADRYSLDQRKAYMAQSAGHDHAVAGELVDLGLTPRTNPRRAGRSGR